MLGQRKRLQTGDAEDGEPVRQMLKFGAISEPGSSASTSSFKIPGENSP